MQSVHRRALLTQVDKLLDERVLLGAGVGSKEILQSVHIPSLCSPSQLKSTYFDTLGLQHILTLLTSFTTFETNYPHCNLLVSPMYIPDLYTTRN
jgi:hypothetical protein